MKHLSSPHVPFLFCRHSLPLLHAYTLIHIPHHVHNPGSSTHLLSWDNLHTLPTWRIFFVLLSLWLITHINFGVVMDWFFKILMNTVWLPAGNWNRRHVLITFYVPTEQRSTSTLMLALFVSKLSVRNTYYLHFLWTNWLLGLLAIFSLAKVGWSPAWALNLLTAPVWGMYKYRMSHTCCIFSTLV